MALLAASAEAVADTNRLIDPAALQADLRIAVDTIERQHPDLSHSVDRARFRRAVEKVRRQLVRPMDQTEAWATMAQLNPVLADGHLLIGLPDWRAQSVEAIRRGTGFFPFEVSLNARGYPVIVSALGGADTPFSGREILQINGRDARDVARELMARVHGDTPAFRAALLSQRWWLFYSKLHGTPPAFDLLLGGTPEARYEGPASHALPSILQRDASFEKLFECRVEDGTARLTVASFGWPDKDRFFQFTHDCFARIKAATASHLVIDVSANGGGDDDMWKEGVLRYIATRPYRHGSTFLKRERSGEVTAGAIQSETAPVPDEPLHFGGKVTVLIGPLTYSSAVLFSNVVKDYGFGNLAGTGGAARTRQSGGTQSVVLPNTGLILSYPRFVLDRPSGAETPTYLTPDDAR